MAEVLVLIEGLHRGDGGGDLEPKVVHDGVQALQRVQAQRVVVLVQQGQQVAGAGLLDGRHPGPPPRPPPAPGGHEPCAPPAAQGGRVSGMVAGGPGWQGSGATGVTTPLWFAGRGGGMSVRVCRFIVVCVCPRVGACSSLGVCACVL